MEDGDRAYQEGFKHGHIAGMREMVEFIRDVGYAQKRYYGNSNGEEDYFEVQFPWEKWQAKIKELGMGE